MGRIKLSQPLIKHCGVEVWSTEGITAGSKVTKLLATIFFHAKRTSGFPIFEQQNTKLHYTVLAIIQQKGFLYCHSITYELVWFAAVRPHSHFVLLYYKRASKFSFHEQIIHRP